MFVKSKSVSQNNTVKIINNDLKETVFGSTQLRKKEFPPKNKLSATRLALIKSKKAKDKSQKEKQSKTSNNFFKSSTNKRSFSPEQSIENANDSFYDKNIYNILSFDQINLNSSSNNGLKLNTPNSRNSIKSFTSATSINEKYKNENVKPKVTSHSLLPNESITSIDVQQKSACDKKLQIYQNSRPSTKNQVDTSQEFLFTSKNQELEEFDEQKDMNIDIPILVSEKCIIEPPKANSTITQILKNPEDLRFNDFDAIILNNHENDYDKENNNNKRQYKPHNNISPLKRNEFSQNTLDLDENNNDFIDQNINKSNQSIKFDNALNQNQSLDELPKKEKIEKVLSSFINNSADLQQANSTLIDDSLQDQESRMEPRDSNNNLLFNNLDLRKNNSTGMVDNKEQNRLIELKNTKTDHYPEILMKNIKRPGSALNRANSSKKNILHKQKQERSPEKPDKYLDDMLDSNRENDSAIKSKDVNLNVNVRYSSDKKKSRPKSASFVNNSNNKVRNYTFDKSAKSKVKFSNQKLAENKTIYAENSPTKQFYDSPLRKKVKNHFDLFKMVQMEDKSYEGSNRISFKDKIIQVIKSGSIRDSSNKSFVETI